jgi:hypothetical protein
LQLTALGFSAIATSIHGSVVEIERNHIVRRMARRGTGLANPCTKKQTQKRKQENMTTCEKTKSCQLILVRENDKDKSTNLN